MIDLAKLGEEKYTRFRRRPYYNPIFMGQEIYVLINRGSVKDDTILDDGKYMCISVSAVDGKLSERNLKMFADMVIGEYELIDNDDVSWAHIYVKEVEE